MLLESTRRIASSAGGSGTPRGSSAKQGSRPAGANPALAAAVARVDVEAGTWTTKGSAVARSRATTSIIASRVVSADGQAALKKPTGHPQAGDGNPGHGLGEAAGGMTGDQREGTREIGVVGCRLFGRGHAGILAVIRSGW